MTYKLTTCPPRTGDNDADLASIFEWAAELSREREIDKRHIRDALLELSTALKTTFTLTNHSALTSLDCDDSTNDQICDFLGSLMIVLNTLKALVAEVS